jgi:hypothetical protein
MFIKMDIQQYCLIGAGGKLNFPSHTLQLLCILAEKMIP